jgi:D-alanine-D-alanine ligase
MQKTRVGVLRGGPSSEYDVSLKTGENVLKHLSRDYDAHDILIDKRGVWHHHGIPRQPHEITPHIDVFLNALHGEYGEDGQVQKILDVHKARYTGSKAFQSAIGMNKAMTRKALKSHDVKMASHILMRPEDYSDARILEIFRTFPQPAIVKPASSGSSVGVTLATSYFDFDNAIRTAFTISPTILIEEYIRGREVTCGVIDNFRGHELYTLMPVEIVKPASNPIFDLKAKYSGESKEVCPADFPGDVTAEVQSLARQIHKALDLSHYSRSDFIVTPKRGVYFLEVNTLPGLTENSLFPLSLTAVGSNVGEFLDHIIKQALL